MQGIKNHSNKSKASIITSLHCHMDWPFFFLTLYHLATSKINMTRRIFHQAEKMHTMIKYINNKTYNRNIPIKLSRSSKNVPSKFMY